MDAVDNPDHGMGLYNKNGMIVMNKQYDSASAPASSTPPPSGGPSFPATMDVAVSGAPG